VYGGSDGELQSQLLFHIGGGKLVPMVRAHCSREMCLLDDCL
jgi:hypothetical protein